MISIIKSLHPNSFCFSPHDTKSLAPFSLAGIFIVHKDHTCLCLCACVTLLWVMFSEYWAETRPRGDDYRRAGGGEPLAEARLAHQTWRSICRRWWRKLLRKTVGQGPLDTGPKQPCRTVVRPLPSVPFSHPQRAILGVSVVQTVWTQPAGQSHLNVYTQSAQ